MPRSSYSSLYKEMEEMDSIKMEFEILSMLQAVSDELTNYYNRDGLMVICMIRYCLGRHTYIVKDCVEWTLRRWDSLPECAKETIKKDLEEAFYLDNIDRVNNSRCYCLGSDTDRLEWRKVKDLWKESPPKENLL